MQGGKCVPPPPPPSLLHWLEDQGVSGGTCPRGTDLHGGRVRGGAQRPLSQTGLLRLGSLSPRPAETVAPPSSVTVLHRLSGDGRTAREAHRPSLVSFVVKHKSPGTLYRSPTTPPSPPPRGGDVTGLIHRRGIQMCCLVTATTTTLIPTQMFHFVNSK
jgi:hypothetical protein